MKIEQNSWSVRLLLALLFAASSAQATLVNITLDENGNATFGGATGIILNQQGADSHASASGNPGGNGATTLDYLYAPPTSTFISMGWVAIYDDANKTILSDLIHFDSSITIGTTTYEQIFFYSSDNRGALADNPLPSGTYGAGDPNHGANVLATILSSAQKITEGANGITAYAPTSGQPGFENVAGGSPSFSYDFVSAPEPSTYVAGVLLLIPFGASALRILRKSRAA